MRHAARVVALATAAAAARVDPRFAANITVYHVNEKTYPVPPENMNTASINGDIYFDLRTRGLPLECGKWRNESFWSMIDCVNDEVSVPVSDLAITKLIVEVDTRWGDYADCNVERDTGEYSCSCQDVPDNCTALNQRHDHGAKCNMSNGCWYDWADQQCEPYGCPNITDRQECVQGYHKCVWLANGTCADPPGPPKVCNGSLVGYLNLSTVEWGRQSYGHRQLSAVDYWHGNTLAKTRGFWYSTWTEGECRPDDPTQSYCSWRVASKVKKVAKACSDASINSAIIHGDRTAPWGARCMDNCSAADRKNSSSECFILCFYANVLGPLGSSTLMNDTSPDFGIPVPELQAAWDKPFKPESEGGCPDISSQEDALAPRRNEKAAAAAARWYSQPRPACLADWVW